MNRLRLAPFTSLLALVAGFAASAAQTPAKKPITLNDIMTPRASGYFPAPLWRPDGKGFAYRDQTGKVMLYDAVALKATEWFMLDSLAKVAKKPDAKQAPFGWQNRRVAETSMEWFPNGRDLLVATGGDLFAVHPDGKFDQLTATPFEEEDPKLSPDGQKVLYRHDSNLYVLTLNGGGVTQLTSDGTETLMNGKLDWVYPEELDLSTASWWSPDSKSLAYFQFNTKTEFVYPQADLLGEHAVAEPERYPQAGTPNALIKLGVVGAAGGETHWMDAGETSYTLLARVKWLPDSKSVAVVRLGRVQDKLDLLFADASTGAARLVLHEDSKSWINVDDSFAFLDKSPEFLWSSEAGPGGFRHLYLYSLDGTLKHQITKGDWEVRRLVAVDESSRSILYTSSQESPVEEHLYRVSLDGGAPTRITREAGTHRIEASNNAAYYVDAHSSLTDPIETTLHDSTGKQLAVLRPADRKVLDEFEVLPTEIVTLKAADGTMLYARLIKPAHFQPGTKYPVVVMVYGGPHAQSVRNAWPGLSWDQVLAHKGYVIWQVDNRGSFGRGRDFEAPIYREMGRTELEDQKAGVEKLLSLGFADGNRIGMFGWSYGGYMTLYSLLHAPDVFRAGIAGAPVTDWHNYDTIYTERYMGLPGENKEGYAKSSNVLAAENLKAKLLIIHNFEDDNVLFQNTLQMNNALQKAGKQFDFMLFPQKSHGVSGPVRKTMYEGMTEFFDRNLKGE